MTPYQSGHFEIRPTERRLLIDGRSAPLGARAFDVLLALVERRDRTVPKNELLDLVWHGLVVEENNLQVQISTLRKVLGQDAISTIPGQGYRFTLPADEAEAHSSPPLAGVGYRFVRAIGPSHSAVLEPNADASKAALPSPSAPVQSMDSEPSRTDVLATAMPTKRWLRSVLATRHSALEHRRTRHRCPALGSGRSQLLARRTQDRVALDC